MKSGKVPGPDEIENELLKILNVQSRSILLGLFNQIWETECLPECLKKANVATIFKKGDIEKLENYRPIALLNGTYKLFAAMVKKRLVAAVDRLIHDTRYGFRKGKNTTQPIFLARRIQDISESF